MNNLITLKISGLCRPVKLIDGFRVISIKAIQ